MENVRTKISLQKSLFEQVEDVAGQMQISRSRFFVLAAEQFIEEYQNRKLLEQINAAYEDEPDATEQDLLRRWRHKQRQLVEEQW